MKTIDSQRFGFQLNTERTDITIKLVSNDKDNGYLTGMIVVVNNMKNTEHEIGEWKRKKVMNKFYYEIMIYNTNYNNSFLGRKKCFSTIYYNIWKEKKLDLI